MTRQEYRQTWVRAGDLIEGDWFVIPQWGPRQIHLVEEGEIWRRFSWLGSDGQPHQFNWVEWPYHQPVQVLVPVP